MTVQYLADIIDEVVTKVSTALDTPVYFQFGSDPVVTQELTQRDNSIHNKDKKFPMVWLVVPYEEVDRMGSNVIARCDVCIVTNTKSTYNMVERRAITYKPILYPIYAELLKQLAKYKKTSNYIKNMTHTKIDYPYWGKNNANLFNDYIDAIQLKGLKLTIKNTC